MTDAEPVIAQLSALVEQHYVFPEVAVKVRQVLADRVADGAYADIVDGPDLAARATADLQSVNGDQHFRLLHHDRPLPEAHGDDDADLAAMREWADLTCGGVARAERLPGNVGHLEIHPLLFPPPVAGDAVAAAMTLLAATDVLILDLRRCLGGEPSMVALLCSYLVEADPVELTGVYERETDRIRQSWTLPHVPGRRFGATKPVYVLTSATTFSGAEAAAYDLQQLGRATVVGERTRGGAHPRRGFRLGPHLEATIPVARAVGARSGGNWEGTGIVPDIATPAAEALLTAYRVALKHVLDLGAGGARHTTAAEARAAFSGA
jgi:hypothetical protein